jgi:hypothetical protein
MAVYSGNAYEISPTAIERLKFCYCLDSPCFEHYEYSMLFSQVNAQ